MRQETGLTLIEVLVAMLILSIGVLALISLITTVVVASHRADQGAMIRVLATDIQERAWIFSSPDDECHDAASMANLNNWSEHPILQADSMPPATLSVRTEASGCILKVTPEGTMGELEYQVTGPKKGAST